MKLANDEKSIEISIDSYEFPYHETNNDYDNNWLNVKAVCEDEVLVEEGIEPCLLTSELQSLLKGLSKALVDVPYTSAFTEPGFVVTAVPKGDVVDMMISFYLPNRYAFEVSSTITKRELDAMVSDVKAMCEAFPVREKRMLN